MFYQMKFMSFKGNCVSILVEKKKRKKTDSLGTPTQDKIRILEDFLWGLMEARPMVTDLEVPR